MGLWIGAAWDLLEKLEVLGLGFLGLEVVLEGLFEAHLEIFLALLAPHLHIDIRILVHKHDRAIIEPHPAIHLPSVLEPEPILPLALGGLESVHELPRQSPLDKSLWDLGSHGAHIALEKALGLEISKILKVYLLC